VPKTAWVSAWSASRSLSAVSIGLWAGGRFSASELPGYIIAQTLGAIVAAATLSYIAFGTVGGDVSLASNGYGDLSPSGRGVASGFTTEVIMTFMFLVIILGATADRAPAGFAPIAIGLGLTLIHLVSIPVTNTSVNPARSTGPALLEGGAAVGQLWLFWVAPILGAIAAGFVYRWLDSTD
jgi:aquaporin Z